MKFILSSSSPRRKALMDIFGFDYEIESSNVENNLVLSSTPKLNAMTAAFMKANDILSRYDDDEDVIVLGADTIVTVGDYQFGKPKDEQDQISTLKFLSGKTHQVITAYALITKKTKYVDYVVTDVTFKKLSEELIMSYVHSDEGKDKAGSYAIQGLGCVLIEKIEGDMNNVIGLPVSKIYEDLKQKFDIDLLNMNK